LKGPIRNSPWDISFKLIWSNDETLYKQLYQHSFIPQEHRWFQSSYSEKKTYNKFKLYCKQNRHFYRDFFLGIPDFQVNMVQWRNIIQTIIPTLMHIICLSNIFIEEKIVCFLSKKNMYRILRTIGIASLIKISTEHSLIIKLIIIKFFRTIWEIGGQMSWDWYCLLN
jgi:hypothetical protein